MTPRIHLRQGAVGTDGAARLWPEKKLSFVLALAGVI